MGDEQGVTRGLMTLLLRVNLCFCCERFSRADDQDPPQAKIKSVLSY